MTNTWILVAHRGGARIFERTGPGKGLGLIRDIPHPSGRLKNQDIGADKPGRSFDSHGVGRHALGKEHEPTEQLAERFARELAGLLDEGRTHRRYAQLVLVAEPRFLGMLRAALTPATAALVVAALDKDLGDIDARELPKHLEGVLRV